MKNQLETLNEVISKFTVEEKQLMNENRFPYIFSKAWVYLKMGAEKYMKNDAFNQQPTDYDEEDLAILSNGCKQLIEGIGMSMEKPFTGLDVMGLYALFRLFHFQAIDRKTHHNFMLNGKNGALDGITFEHIVEGGQVVYYNFCENPKFD